MYILSWIKKIVALPTISGYVSPNIKPYYLEDIKIRTAEYFDTFQEAMERQKSIILSRPKNTSIRDITLTRIPENNLSEDADELLEDARILKAKGNPRMKKAFKIIANTPLETEEETSKGIKHLRDCR